MLPVHFDNIGKGLNTKKKENKNVFTKLHLTAI